MARTLKSGYMKDNKGRRLDSAMSERVRPQTIVYMGDSLTEDGGFAAAQKAGTGAINRSYVALGFATWAQILSGHRLRLLRNLGVAGNTTAQIRARIADVLALEPGYVHDMSGTNNLTTDELLAQAKIDKLAMWDAYDEAGIRVITGPVFPQGTYTADTRRRTDDLNEWIRKTTEGRENTVFVDYFAALALFSGEYQIGFNRDTFHLTAQGAYAAGKALAQVINQIVPPRRVLSSAQGDSANLVTAGRFGGGAVGAIPASWSATTVTGSAFSRTVRTDDVSGYWQTVTIANGSKGILQHNIPVGSQLAVGDYVDAAIEFDISNLDPAPANNTAGFAIRLQSYNGSTFTDLGYAPYFVEFGTPNFPSAARKGTLLTPPIQVPPGTTILIFQVLMYGGGTYNLDRATVRNLTKLGLPTYLG